MSETWLQLLQTLANLLEKADNKLDEYGEPDRSPIRTEMRAIIQVARKTVKDKTNVFNDI